MIAYFYFYGNITMKPVCTSAWKSLWQKKIFFVHTQLINKAKFSKKKISISYDFVKLVFVWCGEIYKYEYLIETSKLLYTFYWLIQSCLWLIAWIL